MDEGAAAFVIGLIIALAISVITVLLILWGRNQPHQELPPPSDRGPGNRVGQG